MIGFRDVLRTPLAAPETPVLRARRTTFVGACALAALSTAGIVPLVAMLGPAGAGGTVLMAFAAAAIACMRWVPMKRRADDAWLSDLVDARRREEEGEQA